MKLTLATSATLSTAGSHSEHKDTRAGKGEEEHHRLNIRSERLPLESSGFKIRSLLQCYYSTPSGLICHSGVKIYSQPSLLLEDAGGTSLNTNKK